jgi:anti-sigma B factor antagonist
VPDPGISAASESPAISAHATVPAFAIPHSSRVPVVPEDPYPVEWTGRQAVVTLPRHIDVSNAGEIREQLLWVINRGATTLIADMTATVSCDHAGADAIIRAYQRATTNGTQLRLVVTAQIVRRVLSVNGLDRLIPVYPSLEAAVAAEAPAAATRVTPSPGLES